MKFRSLFLSLLTGKLDLKAWAQKGVVGGNSKVPIKAETHCLKSHLEKSSSGGMPHVERFHHSILIKVLVIVVHFTLRIYILQ